MENPIKMDDLGYHHFRKHPNFHDFMVKIRGAGVLVPLLVNGTIFQGLGGGWKRLESSERSLDSSARSRTRPEVFQDDKLERLKTTNIWTRPQSRDVVGHLYSC